MTSWTKIRLVALRYRYRFRFAGYSGNLLFWQDVSIHLNERRIGVVPRAHYPHYWQKSWDTQTCESPPCSSIHSNEPLLLKKLNNEPAPKIPRHSLD